MRLVVVSSYWPRPGVAHNAFFEVEQVRALANMGHKLDVLIQTPPWRCGVPYMNAQDLGLDPHQVRLEQIVMPRLPEPLSRGRVGLAFNIRAAGLRMRAWLAERDAAQGSTDAVLVHGERNVGLSAGIWNCGRKRRAAMIMHGADPVLEALPDTALNKGFGRSASGGLSRIILVGNRLRSYAQHVGYSAERVMVIPNGFRHPTPAIAPLRGGELPVRIVTVARLVSVKGIDDALLALSQLRQEHSEMDWRFDILGDGPERGALQSLSAQLGLEDLVFFHGSVPNEQVLDQLKQSAIFLLPSWNEAFGLAYLEAMAMGTAVVGCADNGAADILTGGIDGSLVPPRDVAALAAKLAVLIADPMLRDSLACTAMQSVKRFSWSANAAAVLNSLDGD